MDPYEDSVRLQEMIDSDIQSDIEYILPDDHSIEGPTLTDLAPAVPVVPLDLYDNSLDIEMTSASEPPWITCSSLFGLGSDFEGPGSLLVNPQTGLPNTLPEPETPVAVIIEPTSQVCAINSIDSLSTEKAREDSDSVIMIDETMTSNMCDESESMIEGSSQPLHSDVSQVDSSEMLDATIMSDALLTTPSEVLHNAIICVPVLDNFTVTNVETNKELDQVNVQINGSHTKPNILKTKQKTKTVVSQDSKDEGNNQFGGQTYPKPAFSYSCLIAMALKNSKTGSLPVNEIYNFMTENFPYFKTAPNGWKNSVRHNLSLNKCFEKVDKPPDNNGNQRKGCLWAMNPDKIEKMDEEVLKWSRKDPLAIQRSMANPDKFALLEKGHMKDKTDSEMKEIILMESKKIEEIRTQETEVVSSEQKPITVGLTGMKACTVDSTEPKINAVILQEVKSSTDDMGMDTGLNLDSSLEELELQKGIWEELDDDRLHFLSESISSSSSSPQPTSIVVTNILSAEETLGIICQQEDEAAVKELQVQIKKEEEEAELAVLAVNGGIDHNNSCFDQREDMFISLSTSS